MYIFIIDDDHLSLFLTESMLLTENSAKEVKSFLSATEALQELQKGSTEAPDIIFLDLNMPVMDGWGFLDAVSSDFLVDARKCGIYILTSSLDLADISRASEYPIVTGFMHKPITIEDIRLAIEHAETAQAHLS